MKEEKIKELIEYWLATAEHDRDVMEYLYAGGKYSNSLFFGHIILEKILKALVVLKTKTEAPYTHDLLKLLQMTQLTLLEEERRLLAVVNDFNIRARYADYKLEFYKKATKSYTESHLSQIKALYTKLWQIMKQK